MYLYSMRIWEKLTSLNMFPDIRGKLGETRDSGAVIKGKRGQAFDLGVVAI